MEAAAVHSEDDLLQGLNQAEDPIETENCAAKAVVLASSSDEGAASNVSSQASKQNTQPQTNGKVSKPKPDSAGTNGAGNSRPKLLFMKLSETDTSDDEAKYRKKQQSKGQENEGTTDSDVNTNVATIGSKKGKTGKWHHIITSEEESNNDQEEEDEEEFNPDSEDADDDVQQIDS